MRIEWFLNRETGRADWRFMAESEDCAFTVHQSLEEFLSMVDALHETCARIKELMAGGMDVKAAIAEAERITSKSAASQEGSREIKDQAGKVVGTTDKVYPVDGNEVVFEEAYFSGVVNGPLFYNGKWLKIVSVAAQIGLLVDEKGVRGPVSKGVRCLVIDNGTKTPV